MNIEIITKDELEKFKGELLDEIRKLLRYPVSKDNVAKEWLKSSEVRKLLRVSAGTLQNLRLNGILPYSKIGGLMYYRYKDIQKLLESAKK